MNADEAVNSLLEILKAHELRSDSFQQELDSIHVEWQRDRGRNIRLEAQIKALRSMVSEMCDRLGLDQAHVEACFQERFRQFQDEELQAYESASADLAAHIDNRVAGEIPTEKGFRPLFPPKD